MAANEPALHCTPPKNMSALLLLQVLVEPNHVYVLSDNRDALNDSRFFGAVAEDRVIGRLAVIWISFTLEGIRWERIGNVL
jgi:hypothetical protein